MDIVVQVVWRRQSECYNRIRCVLDLQKIMAESRDYDELLFAWKGWRDSAGKVLREDYKRYVELANKAATLNGTTLHSPRPLLTEKKPQKDLIIQFVVVH